jgi:hypothetical protein
MRSVYEQKIVDGFLNELKRNGLNPIWAYNYLEYKVFVEHKEEFYNLPYCVQWEVREILMAIQKTYK